MYVADMTLIPSFLVVPELRKTETVTIRKPQVAPGTSIQIFVRSLHSSCSYTAGRELIGSEMDL
jgi:hypothetical protein